MVNGLLLTGIYPFGLRLSKMGKGKVCLYRRPYMEAILDIMIMIRKRATGMKKMMEGITMKKGITIKGKEPEYGNAIATVEKDFGWVPIREVSRMVYGYAMTWITLSVLSRKRYSGWVFWRAA